MPDALPATTLPIYPGLEQAPIMLGCIPGGFLTLSIIHVKMTTIHVKMLTDILSLDIPRPLERVEYSPWPDW